MLTYEDAKEIAFAYVQAMNNDYTAYDPVYLAYLRKNNPTYNQEQITLVLTKSREESFGWIFFYDSKEFLETGDFSKAVVGNAPVIIDRATGELTETGTAHSIEYYIEQYKTKVRLH
ncbi:YrhB domain-containing protein [Spirosoma litoris]